MNALVQGGVAILFPPGWQMLEEVVLVKGRCVAALVQDRTCKFYVISVYIHPDNRSGDMEALLRAWRFLEKKSDYAFVAGDFNGIDKHRPQLWEKFLLQFQCSDVYPELATFRHARGVSCLDRGLVPDSLTNSSKLYASASVLVSHVANGHDIVKIRINVRPNVLNNPHHPKHEVIPSGVFMPGKDGTPISSTSELQSLVRLLHREHGRLFTEWHCEDVLNRTLLPPPPVTGRCSPLDNGFVGSAVCLTLLKLFRAFRKFLMETLPQLLFSLICPKHLRGLTPIGSLSCSGLEGHRDGCMHMRNLSCSTAESHIKYKEGFCRAEQSCKVLTWGGPSQCTYSVWPWTRCSLT